MKFRSDHDRFFGLLYAFLAMNGVGFGMLANGWDYPGNPAWEFCQLFFDIELVALGLIFVSALVYAIFKFMPSGTEGGIAKPERNAPGPTPIVVTKPLSVDAPTEQKSGPPREGAASPKKKAAPDPPVPAPPKELSAEELKLKAIKQITKGW